VAVLDELTARETITDAEDDQVIIRNIRGLGDYETTERVRAKHDAPF
jgi:hypothetical protein